MSQEPQQAESTDSERTEECNCPGTRKGASRKFFVRLLRIFWYYPFATGLLLLGVLALCGNFLLKSPSPVLNVTALALWGLANAQFLRGALMYKYLVRKRQGRDEQPSTDLSDRADIVPVNAANADQEVQPVSRSREIVSTFLAGTLLLGGAAVVIGAVTLVLIWALLGAIITEGGASAFLLFAAVGAVGVLGFVRI